MLGSWVETIAQQAQTAIERTNFGSPASMKLRNLIMGAMYGNIKYEDLEKKLAATESKQTEYLKIIQDLEEEKRDLLRVKKQHESDSVARDEANDKIAALEVDLEQAYSARDELVWRCFDRDRQLREVDGQLKKLEMDRTEYMKRLTSSQINADTLTAERLELLKANSAWEASVRSLSVELGGVRAQRDALEKEVEELKRKEALTSKKLALAEDATSNLESLKAVNELCLQEVTESREELHSVLDQMTYAFEKGNIELAELRNELGRYKGREARQLARRNTLKSKGEKVRDITHIRSAIHIQPHSTR
jgi:chromosome segregation ATPase